MPIIIYPFEDSVINRSNVSIYIRYYCKADTLQVQSTISAKIGNGQPKVDIHANLLDKTQFRQGFGSPKIFFSSCFAEDATIDVSSQFLLKSLWLRKVAKLSQQLLLDLM